MLSPPATSLYHPLANLWHSHRGIYCTGLDLGDPHRTSPVPGWPILPSAVACHAHRHVPGGPSPLCLMLEHGQGMAGYYPWHGFWEQIVWAMKSCGIIFICIPVENGEGVVCGDDPLGTLALLKGWKSKAKPRDTQHYVTLGLSPSTVWPCKNLKQCLPETSLVVKLQSCKVMGWTEPC